MSARMRKRLYRSTVPCLLLGASSLGCEPSTVEPTVTPKAQVSPMPSGSTHAASIPRLVRSRRLSIPGRGSTPEQIRSFLEEFPAHDRAPVLRARHDWSLLPCPGHEAHGPSCTPEVPELARGVLQKADAYLQHCFECKQRALVEQTRKAAKRIVARHAREQAQSRFELAMVRYDHAAASRALQTYGKDSVWARGAKRRLERRLGDLELDPCEGDPELSVFISPRWPRAGEPLTIVVMGQSSLAGATLSSKSYADPTLPPSKLTPSSVVNSEPRYLVARGRAISSGIHDISVRTRERRACHRIQVWKKRRLPPSTSHYWRTVRDWNQGHEELYAAWLHALFQAPEGTRWRGLSTLTRDPQRNFLHNHLGIGEDGERGVPKVDLRPDCADNPHFLRAYFAWKLGLPFGFHECRYGEVDGPPRCGNWWTNEGPGEPQPEEKAEKESEAASSRGLDAGVDGAVRKPLPAVVGGPRERFSQLLWRVKNSVVARSLRTELIDEATDLYPVVLTRPSLNPGAVYSDPYGHTLTLVRWIPQTESQPGQLLAVDAQPDGTLTIKRFWRGNFLFPDRHPLGGHGFKVFRPIVRDRARLRLLTNDEIRVAASYGAYSSAQRRMKSGDFYGTLEALINPRALPPQDEYRALHRALHAQLRARVGEIDLAEEILAERDGRVIAMPRGREIFHTTGPWEALSTPCRDMRLLVGMDVLQAFPEQAVQALLDPREAKALQTRLKELHRKLGQELSISYTRSDGSKQRLSLGELLQREKVLEMGYNPNDCPELRWGAPDGSQEGSSCKRTAPNEQRTRMLQMRHWFVKRYSCG